MRFRATGLGTKMVRAAISQTAERRYVKLVQLTVPQGNEAGLALYEREQFVDFGVEPFAVAVGESYASKVHMWRNVALPTG